MTVSCREDNSSDKDDIFAGISLSNFPVKKMASTGGIEEQEKKFPFSYLLSSMLNNKELSESGKRKGVFTDKNGREWGEYANVLSEEHPPWRVDLGHCYKFTNTGNSLHYKRSRGRSVKHITSLEARLAARLQKEQVDMGKNVFCSNSSLISLPGRSLVIAPGNLVMSHESSVESEYEGANLNENNGLMLDDTRMVSNELPTMNKKRRERAQQNDITFTTDKIPKKHFQPDKMLFFCLGIGVGVMSTINSNKKEIDDLKESLRQAQNLIQDLQEELDMKISLTLKDLTSEKDSVSVEDPANGESLPLKCSIDSLDGENDSNPTQSSFLPDSERDEYGQYKEQIYVEKSGCSSSDLMSKVEAELEAELEMLELNINRSRISDLEELDPDADMVAAEVVHGELREDMLGARLLSASDPDKETNTNPHSSNYAVSPKELSLRLHELFEWRLREQISELQSALSRNRKRLCEIESEPTENSHEDFSNTETESFSYQENPSTERQQSPPHIEGYHMEERNLISEDNKSERDECKLSVRSENRDLEFENHLPEDQILRSQKSYSRTMEHDDGGNNKESVEAELTNLSKNNLLEETKQGSPTFLNIKDPTNEKGSTSVEDSVNEEFLFNKCSDDSLDRENALNTDRHSICLEGERDDDKPFKEKMHMEKSGSSSDLMSKIEAELEAELEMLELNIKSSRLSDLDEFDLDTGTIAEVVHGELREDVLSTGLLTPSEPDKETTTNPHSSNYAVSPKELSLRLYELIEGRLQEQILELQSTLSQSQKLLYGMESRFLENSQKHLSKIKNKSLSTQESPIVNEQYSPLSALSLYNEVYDMEERNFMPEDHTSGGDEYTLSNKSENRDLEFDEYITWGGRSRSRDSDYQETIEYDDNDNDSDEDEDELNNLLIRQLLEKTKQGSAAVLNVQRMLLSMEEKHQ